MKRLVVLSIVFSSFSLSVAEEKEDAAAKKLAGKWTVKSMIRFGEKVDAESIKDDYFTIENGKLTSFQKGQKVFSATIKVDITKKPAELDMKIIDGLDKGEKTPAIYQLEGEKLTICFGPKRPKKFESKIDSDDRLIELVLSK